MAFKIEAFAYDVPDAVLGLVAINCWSDDSPPKRFVVFVSRTYADNRGWNREIGLKKAVEQHRDELLDLAKDATARGCVELDLLA